eukprot:TRINITY_DN93610_c0_g1_i1.p1 TRINITY_DN93610_c0_g1~~TRINITY_DN93610_c0_g1_i1.p1  ORF type:complete len:325 (+),score=48.20 TRINITY_DN93610_c0_g1_i1:121-1095(+)
MINSFRSVPGSRIEQNGDHVIYWSSMFALVCGALAAGVAAYGCWEPVLSSFVPELGWLLLVPAALITTLGIVGLVASRGNPSKLFRAQLALFLLLLAALLAGAGIFAFIFSAAASRWIFDGCVGYRNDGFFGSQAGRISPKLEFTHKQYERLACSWRRCREFNPLVYDLEECGIRARCEDEDDFSGKQLQVLASSMPLFRWFQFVQNTYNCGGFCADEVPIFGLKVMSETLVKKEACMTVASDLVESSGRTLSIAAILVGVPVSVLALVLLCSAETAGDDFEEVYGDESDAEDWNHGPYTYADECTDEEEIQESQRSNHGNYYC